MTDRPKERVAREIDSLREFILDLTVGLVNPEAINRAFRDHEEGILEALRIGGEERVGYLDGTGRANLIFGGRATIFKNPLACKGRPEPLYRRTLSTETDAPGEGEEDGCCCSCEHPLHRPSSYGETCIKCGKHRPPGGRIRWVGEDADPDEGSGEGDFWDALDDLREAADSRPEPTVEGKITAVNFHAGYAVVEVDLTEDELRELIHRRVRIIHEPTREEG